MLQAGKTGTMRLQKSKKERRGRQGAGFWRISQKSKEQRGEAGHRSDEATAHRSEAGHRTFHLPYFIKVQIQPHLVSILPNVEKHIIASFTNCLQRASPSGNCFAYRIPTYPSISLWGGQDLDLHCTDDETVAQRCWATCPKPQSRPVPWTGFAIRAAQVQSRPSLQLTWP